MSIRRLPILRGIDYSAGKILRVEDPTGVWAELKVFKWTGKPNNEITVACHILRTGPTLNLTLAQCVENKWLYYFHSEYHRDGYCKVQNLEWYKGRRVGSLLAAIGCGLLSIFGIYKVPKDVVNPGRNK